LCSDGLAQYTTRKTLAQLLVDKDTLEAAEGLIDFANQEGGSDNISVLLIELTDSPSEYPTEVPRDVPGPAELDLMSTSPGGGDLWLLGKPRRYWTRILIIGSMVLSLSCFLLIGYFLIPNKFRNPDPTPTLSQEERFIRETEIYGSVSADEEESGLVTPTSKEDTADATVTEVTPTIEKNLQENLQYRKRLEDSMVQVQIPAGGFLMGITDNDLIGLGNMVEFNNEIPQHHVWLDSYWIDEHEVTFLMFVNFLNSRTEKIKLSDWINDKMNDKIKSRDEHWFVAKEFENQPVFNVYWDGANEYCQWVGQRLPTEAEWERAAKGNLDQAIFPWGKEPPICDQEAKNGALFKSCEEREPNNVKSFNPNSFGLYDMSGNVWEWVSDWFGRYNDDSVDMKWKVMRGGGAASKIEYLRTTNRAPDIPKNPQFTLDFVGFRCAEYADVDMEQ